MEEKDEQEKFSHLVDNVTVAKETFISQTHKLAMATGADDIHSVDTCLTKGDIAPPKASTTEDWSTLTGETCESKSKAYAAEDTRKVSLQYVQQIDSMKVKRDQTVADLQSEMDAILQLMSIN